MPFVFGTPRLTVNVYGPAPVPADAPLVHVEDVPPTVTSAVVESKPVTDSLNVTEQVRLVAFVGVVAGKQESAEIVGAIVSMTMSLLKPRDPAVPGVGSV